VVVEIEPRTVEAVDTAWVAGRPSRLRMRVLSSAPERLRAFAAASVVLMAVLAVLFGFGVRAQRAGLATIGGLAGPVVEAAADLYFTLNDMDAQVANVLLVGDDQTLGFTRAQALAIYEQRRRQADADLQTVAAAGGDTATGDRIRGVLDLLGSYEALATQTVVLAQQMHAPAGHPPAAALATYRQATDLLTTRLLPAAHAVLDRNAQLLERTYQARRGAALATRAWVGVVGGALLTTRLLPAAHAVLDRNAQLLERTYQARRGAALATRAWVGVVGGALLLLLLAFQGYLVRRFHRLINPALAVATLVAVALTVAGAGTMSGAAEHLRVAKKDAFDSVLALTEARAVSYDANADESRYLVDPGRAQRYQDGFLAKSRQLVDLPGASISSFDADFAAAVRRYQADHADVSWGGYVGTEFRNITFTGERAAAETALLRYQAYQVDDRKIRQMVAGGQLAAAIAFCTSYQPGRSNYAFDSYDKALAALIAINTDAFNGAVRDGSAEVGTWRVGLLGAGACVVVVLVLVGAARRLAEYR